MGRNKKYPSPSSSGKVMYVRIGFPNLKHRLHGKLRESDRSKTVSVTQAYRDNGHSVV